MKFLKTWVLLLGISISLSAQWIADGEATVVAGGNSEAFTAPVWSPTNPNLIAITKPGYRGIWLLDLQQKQIRQLIDEMGAGFHFSWSHNGLYIAARITKYDRLKPFNEIVVIDVESGLIRTVTNEKVRLRDVPHWSITDREIYAFSKNELLVFPLDFVISEVTSIGDEWFIYNANGKIGFSKRTEKAALQHNRLDPFPGKRYINLTVSPKGTHVAFEVMGGNLYTMELATQDIFDLGEGYRPAWSPDGEYLTYMITEDDGHRFTASDIYIIKRDGSGKVNITSSEDHIELNPSWAPDGKRLAFDDYLTGEILILPIRQIAEIKKDNQSVDQ
jgi:Tol biopolymer transport system component